MNFKVMILACVFSVECSAYEFFRPSETALKFTDKGDFHSIESATVVWAKYELLRSDFPELSSLSHEEIDAWIGREFALLSRPQMSLQDLRIINVPNTAFSTPPKQLFVPRGPWHDDRGAIALAELNGTRIGFIRLWGTGFNDERAASNQRELFEGALRNPRWTGMSVNMIQRHSGTSGMLSVGGAIAKLSVATATQMAMDIHNAEHSTAFQTSEIYFIVDLGIRIILEGGKSIPAAVVGQQSYFPHLERRPVVQIPESIAHIEPAALQTSAFGSLVNFRDVTVTTPEIVRVFSQQGLAGNEETTAHRLLGEEIADDCRTDRSLIDAHLQTILAPLISRWREVKPFKSPYVFLERIAREKRVPDVFFQEKELIERLIHQDPSKFIRAMQAMELWDRKRVIIAAGEDVFHTKPGKRFLARMFTPREGYSPEPELITSFILTKDITRFPQRYEWLEYILKSKLNNRDIDPLFRSTFFRHDEHLKSLCGEKPITAQLLRHALQSGRTLTGACNPRKTTQQLRQNFNARDK